MYIIYNMIYHCIKSIVNVFSPAVYKYIFHQLPFCQHFYKASVIQWVTVLLFEFAFLC